jgi:hypothetical protein
MSGTGIEREPCPYRIIDDAGGAFGFGKISSILYKYYMHFIAFTK